MQEHPNQKHLYRVLLRLASTKLTHVMIPTAVVVQLGVNMEQTELLIGTRVVGFTITIAIRARALGSRHPL